MKHKLTKSLGYILFILVALSACREAEYSMHRVVTDFAVDEVEMGIPDRDPSCIDYPWLYEIVGEVQDSDGVPLENSMVQVCITSPSDSYICQSPVRSDIDGKFQMVVSERYRCMDRAVIRALSVDILSTTYYKVIELPEVIEETNDPTYSLSTPIVLHDTRPASIGFETMNVIINDPETDTTPYPVYFLDGLEIDMVPADFMGITGVLLDMRGARVESDGDGLGFAPDADQFEGFYGFWPEANITSPEGFAVRIPNPMDHAIGTKIDLYVLGGLSCTDSDGEKIHEGEWKKTGTGTVVGKLDNLIWTTYIESDSDGGIPCITWLGYKVQ
jgi:hypothetical protein